MAIVLGIVGPVLAALAAAAAGFALLGLPGAVLMEIAVPLFGLQPALERLGPGAWGVAVWLSVVAPAGIPPGCWLVWAIVNDAGWLAWIGGGLAGYVIAGVLAAPFIMPPGG